MIDDAQLILLRHGRAGAQLEDAAADFARPLTRRGRRQAVDAGQLLRQVGPKVSACYTSPAARCAETAALACASLKVSPEARKALMQMTPQEGAAVAQDGAAVLVVVHGPEADDLVKHLTGRAVHMKKGALASVQIHNGQGSLQQLLQPKDIRAWVKPSKPPSGRVAAALSEPVLLTLAHEPPRARARRARGGSRRHIRWGVTR